MAMAFFYPEWDGYDGIRVHVRINGTLKQRWFNLRGLSKKQRKEAMDEAMALNERWIEEKHKAKILADTERDHPLATIPLGLTGIRLTYSYQEHDFQCLPYIRVTRTVNGEKQAQMFSVKRNGLEKAWHQAVELYARQRKLPPKLKRKVLAKKPDAKTCKKFRRHVQSLGLNMSTATMREWGML